MSKKTFRPYSQLQPSDIDLINQLQCSLQNFLRTYPEYAFRQKPSFRIQVRIAIERISLLKQYLVKHNNHAFISEVSAVSNDCLSIAQQLTVGDFNSIKDFYYLFYSQYSLLQSIVHDLMCPK